MRLERQRDWQHSYPDGPSGSGGEVRFPSEEGFGC